MSNVRPRSPDASRMSYAAISTTSYISGILRLLAAPGSVPIGRSRCGTYACMIQYTVVGSLELRSASGDCLVPGTAGACLGARCLIRLSPVHSSTARVGTDHTCSHGVDTSTHSRDSFRVRRPLTKLPPEPVHLDLELGNLPTFGVQPFRYPPVTPLYMYENPMQTSQSEGTCRSRVTHHDYAQFHKVRELMTRCTTARQFRLADAGSLVVPFAAPLSLGGDAASKPS